MASTITVFGRDRQDVPHRESHLDAALRVFRQVDATCSRFDPHSPLTRANASPDRWHRVPPVLFQAVVEAHRAYLRTRGRFDPRVLGDLVRLGYDRSRPFDDGDGGQPARAPAPVPVQRRPGTWRPRFRGGPSPEIHLGGVPIDLGGIGKGLAVRWAAERLTPSFDDYLIDAGGDCICRGNGPDGEGWSVGVEDPHGDAHGGPAAVIALRDVACATSSTRVRRWRSGGRDVHHLIDPRTGAPGGGGLSAVTVVADDPADAEVLSKTLFLCGPGRIGQEARRREVAALWIDSGGVVSESPRFDRYVTWRAS